MKKTALQKNLLVILVVLGWFTLITQFYVNLNSELVPAAESVTRYFSYFTINSNLMVAICATILLVNPAATNLFTRQSVQTAIAVYIFIVALIYNLVLRFLWSPEGLQMVLDELEHVINPLLFLVYWVLFSNKDKLPSNAFWPWLIFPLVYLFLVLIRGGLSGFYPYPFLDITKLGVQSVISNCIAITLLFIGTSAAFRFIGAYIAGRRGNNR